MNIEKARKEYAISGSPIKAKIPLHPNLCDNYYYKFLTFNTYFLEAYIKVIKKIKTR